MSPSLQYAKFFALLALTAGGAGLAAYHQANPAVTWCAVAIAVVSSLVLGLTTPPAAAKTIAEQHAMLDRITQRLDDKINAADRSTKS
jgi:hypothetical protein